jgi:hypothetical protein
VEGVIFEEWATWKQFLRQQQKNVLGKLKGTLGMYGFAKSMNK